MAMYFFDFRSGDAVSLDVDGVELLDAEAAHREALQALADAISDAVLPGQQGQDFAIEVRDELGPVLKITAVLGSIVIRKQ